MFAARKCEKKEIDTRFLCRSTYALKLLQPFGPEPVGQQIQRVEWHSDVLGEAARLGLGHVGGPVKHRGEVVVSAPAAAPQLVDVDEERVAEVEDVVSLLAKAGHEGVCLLDRGHLVVDLLEV